MVKELQKKVNCMIFIYRKNVILRYGIMLIYLMLWFFLSDRNSWLTFAVAIGIWLGWLSGTPASKDKS